MSKTEKNLYQYYEEFRQGLVWKEGTTEDEQGRALTVLQQFLKFLVEKEWKSGVSSRRDQFIMAALQGSIPNSKYTPEDLAEFSIKCADAAIAQADE